MPLNNNISFTLFSSPLWYLGEARRCDLEQYIGTSALSNASRAHICIICAKDFVRRDHVINHLESVHFPESYNYTCNLCGVSFNTKNKLYKHNFKLHKENLFLRKELKLQLWYKKIIKNIVYSGLLGEL